MLTDESLMPWGKYKGTKMPNVPDEYLLWLHDEKKCNGEVLNYIEDNLDALRKNASKPKGIPTKNW